MDVTTLGDKERVGLHGLIRDLPSPYEDLERFLIQIYPIFASLPRDILAQLFAFRNAPEAPGFLVLRNFPVDEEVPETPIDGKRSDRKATFVSEACILGVGKILGEPFGYYAEREGQVVQNLCPLRAEARATSSESSEIFLGYHTDFNFDKDNPDQPYNVLNPDFILFCLRPDRLREAFTLYTDARDVCRKLTQEQNELLRQPLFQFGASYSFTEGCKTGKVWSAPTPLIKGPARYPEISVDLLCGSRGITEEANRMLDALRQVCILPDVSKRVCLETGDLLLINNRKGAHARSPFEALYDGKDRWLQRLYVRRSLWELRKGTNENIRVF